MTKKDGRMTAMFIAPSAYPLGGVATWLDYLLPGLEKLNWHCTLGLLHGHYHNSDKYLGSHPFYNAVQIESPTGTQEGRVRSLVSAIKGVDPDVVLAVNVPDTHSAIARLSSSLGKRPRSVMTIHGLEADLMQDAQASSEMIDAVICTNRLTCAAVSHFAGIEEVRVHYAPYGVSARESASDNDEDLADPLRIVHVGRLEQQQKRITDLPEIAEHLKSLGVKFSISIAGSGPDEELLREEIRSRELEADFHFLGRVPQEELPGRVYQKADVLLLTPQWETGPIVAWEAMSEGLAVVTSRYTGSGIEGSLRHGENCLMFPVGDTASAARCIQSLEDTSLRSILTRNARELVANRYSLESSIKAWDRALKKVIAMPPQSAPREAPVPIVRGRLDRWIGNSAAENIRQALGIRFRHETPGGEWPHSYGSAKSDESFYRELDKLDLHSVHPGNG